ncbi:hypothetical protein HPB50_024743 [Hyalomma asiaticum]|uniref:Uncharacterized protein n=1 Tax=Hyalomma asiaticum TaxID=266040 RepID=A0ACB7SH52_HYAAI|nr:hypothetical protein HPB50_024743 [Hyalomma asiaticum]
MPRTAAADEGHREGRDEEEEDRAPLPPEPVTGLWAPAQRHWPLLHAPPGACAGGRRISSGGGAGRHIREKRTTACWEKELPFPLAKLSDPEEAPGRLARPSVPEGRSRWGVHQHDAGWFSWVEKDRWLAPRCSLEKRGSNSCATWARYNMQPEARCTVRREGVAASKQQSSIEKENYSRQTKLCGSSSRDQDRIYDQEKLLYTCSLKTAARNAPRHLFFVLPHAHKAVVLLTGAQTTVHLSRDAVLKSWLLQKTKAYRAAIHQTPALINEPSGEQKRARHQHRDVLRLRKNFVHMQSNDVASNRIRRWCSVLDGELCSTAEEQQLEAISA